MPKPDDDTVQDDPIEVTGDRPAPTLDQVHSLNQAHVEAEDEADAAARAEDEELDGGDDDADDDNPDAVDADADDADDDDVVVDDDDAGDADDEPAAPVTPEAPAPVIPESTGAELNTDITKNGAGKVAIKDAEGNTMYFNSLEEVPEDFEPATYKELMRGVSALNKKEASDAVAIEKTQRDAEAAEHTKATTELQKSWDADADAMVAAGTLPKDPAKREAAQNEVYDYIEKEMTQYQKTGGKEGALHTSFRSAYKAMVYDKQQAENAKKSKDLADAKKKRGGIVQGGSGGADAPATGARGGRVIEAPPSGAGLDAVHNRAVNSL